MSRFPTLCRVSPASLLRSRFYSAPPHPARSGDAQPAAETPTTSTTASTPGSTSPPTLDDVDSAGLSLDTPLTKDPQPSQAEPPLRKMTIAEQDEATKQKLLGRDGGQSVLSTENGEWNGLPTHVKNNMVSFVSCLKDIRQIGGIQLPTDTRCSLAVL